jgi:hypothetical protein
VAKTFERHLHTLLPNKLAFALANGGDCVAEYVGITHYEAYRNDREITRMDIKAVYCPQAHYNIMSVGQLWKNGAVFDGRTN